MIGMLVSVFVGCCFAGCLYFVVAVCWQLPAWLQVRRVLLVAGLGDGAMRLLALVCC